MFTSKKKPAPGGGDASALDALLDAERAVTARLQEAERNAERLLRAARTAATLADEAAEREVQETLRLLDQRAAEQRATDVRRIRDEAARRRALYAEADDARVAAIAERLAAVVAPAAEP